MGDLAMAYAYRHDEPAEVVIRAHPAFLHRRLLQAGRVLVTGGWLILTYTTVGNGNGAVNAAHALVGLAFLLLGASLIALWPVANRLPGATRAGNVVADAVLLYSFTPAGN